VNVHLLSRPRDSNAWMPAGAISALADGLSHSGLDVCADVAPAARRDRRAAAPLRAHSRPTQHWFRYAVDVCATDIRRTWHREQPDVVHAFGHVAAAAALRVGEGKVPVVATFSEDGPPAAYERWLASQVDGLAVPSTQERERWHRAGVPADRIRVVPPPVVVADPDAHAPGSGQVVVTDATGNELETIVDSMPFWAPARLVVLGAVPAKRLALVSQAAEHLGVLDRIEFRPGLRAEQRDALMAEADIAIACTTARSGALVTEAAAHGVGAVAVDRDAHRDLVVSRATGLLIPVDAGIVALGEAVRRVIRDPLVARGYGSAALVRTVAIQSPDVVAQRVVATYDGVVERHRVGAQRGACAGSQATPPATTEQGASEQASGEAGDEPERREQRDQLATEYLPLARQLAGRYAGRGQPLEDLVQVASLGLVKAADRFDPERGTAFAAYASPTILGELRRYFRDHAWSVRVPRSMQEASLEVENATYSLAQSEGETPSAHTVGREVGCSDDEVRRAWQTRSEALGHASLDLPVGEDHDQTLADLIGSDDGRLDDVEAQVAVREALARLPEQEREIITLRFFGERTQQSIAEQLGVSQVHVSRTLTRTLAAIRDHIMNETPLPETWSPEPQRVPVGSTHA
jgi:RNA polymerase sigma-B factor